MSSENIQHLIAMVVYMLFVVGIGVYFAKRANKNASSYFLGGRTLGPWVAAFSAEASDMSGWLLMGLPGLAYWSGLASAGWTAIGLFIGTYFNWLIVSKRLHKYSVKVDAITIPGFFSKRFHENKKVILTIASLFIVIFFTVYAGQCLASCGKLFENLFGLGYHEMMIAAAIFVLLYTFLGGFLAESASDFMQAIVMIVALVAIFVLAVFNAGGWSAVIANANNYDGFMSLFQTATPSTTEPNVFGSAEPYSFLSICSCLAWGLGYFGMPQVLLRFMAIRKEEELPRSRRIAMIWVVISLAVAVFIGIVGRVIFPTALLTKTAAESIFITLSTSYLPPILAGFVMAGILAATISSSDSYLLISASAFAKNIYQGVIKKDASDKQVMLVTRITLLSIAVIAALIALDEKSIIFQIVSFAWAGFGATFGPLMILSLFWKRINRAGAIAGMISGAGMVFLWKLVISKIGGVFGIYELLPAFIFSTVMIVVVSLLTKAPSKEIEEDFEAVKKGEI